MDIHFIKSKYGVYGGGLDEPYTHLCRFFSDKFQTEDITFPYSEIEIQLAFLSAKVKDAKYLEWYEKLPTYYRGKNMLRIVLPVAKDVKTLADVFALFYRAFDILISKKKKNDFIDEQKLRLALHNLEQALQTLDLCEIHHRYEALCTQEVIEHNRQGRLIREQASTEKKRLIRDVRFYYHLDGIDKLYFSPYAQELCDRITETLRERKFRLSGYTHLYIMVSNSFENALYHAIRLEDWFIYGIAVLEDYVSYADMKEVDKAQVVFNLIKQGLYDIAKIDKLDIEILNEVLDETEDFLRKQHFLL